MLSSIHFFVWHFKRLESLIQLKQKKTNFVEYTTRYWTIVVYMEGRQNQHVFVGSHCFWHSNIIFYIIIFIFGSQWFPNFCFWYILVSQNILKFCSLDVLDKRDWFLASRSSRNLINFSGISKSKGVSPEAKKFLEAWQRIAPKNWMKLWMNSVDCLKCTGGIKDGHALLHQSNKSRYTRVR